MSPEPTVAKRHLPLVNSPPLITQGHGHSSGLVEAEVLAVVVIVRRDPAHPHQGGILTGKHSHRVVELPLKKQMEPEVNLTEATLSFLCIVRFDSEFTVVMLP